MTFTIQSTDYIYTGSGSAFQFLAHGDSWALTAGTTFAATTTTAVYGTGVPYGDLTALVDGNVYADGVAISLSGARNDVIVGTTGSVSSTGTYLGESAIYVGIGGSIINRGSVTSTGVGVSINGGSLIDNSGTITGRTDGVFIGPGNGGGNVLINSGLISGGQQGSDVASTRFYHGVHVEGWATRIVNHGTITAADIAGAGVNLGAAFGGIYGAAGSTVENYGAISSVLFWGIDMGNMAVAGGAIFNHGLISGGLGGLNGSTMADLVLNRSTIQGLVSLGGGSDSFDGHGGAVAGWVFGGDDEDTVIGGVSDDSLTGDNGYDYVIGKGGEDALYGGQQDDTLRGGSGDDVILGEVGNDSLAGGDGDDLIYGGSGVDRLAGGAGADQFIFTIGLELGSGANRDQITDFGKGDLVDLHMVTSGLVFVGAAAFSGLAKEIRYNKGSGVLFIDSNGDGFSDYQLEFTNSANLTAASFIL